MTKRVLAALACLLLLVCGCSRGPSESGFSDRADFVNMIGTKMNAAGTGRL